MAATIRDPETGAKVSVEVSGRIVPTPAEAREAARAAFTKRIHKMEEIIDGEEFNPANRDKVAAFQALTKVGMGGSISIDDVRVRLIKQNQAIYDHLGPGAVALIEKLAEVWQ